MASAQLSEATTLDGESVATLRGVFGGGLITADDPVYESARSVWNGNVDRRPALVARCTGVADVQQTVEFGREHNLLVSVRGGGHERARVRYQRRRFGYRSVTDERDPRGPRGPHGAGWGWGALAGVRPGNSSVRTSHHRGDRVEHWDRRADTGRRTGLVDG